MTPDDPRLPAGRAGAILISNTYHEFANPRLMLDHSYRALRPGGRLVIVDRGPGVDGAHGHEVAPTSVEMEVRQQGFAIVRRDDQFIERTGDDPWWLLVAKRP